jgi:hypothetical protein
MADDKSLPALAAELWDMVRAYAKQETIEPMKGLGRFVAFGVAGSLLLGTGTALLALAGLRALQTETDGRLDNHLSFVPYLIVLVVCTVLIVLAMSRTKRKERS